jgi:hypothetical protein
MSAYFFFKNSVTHTLLKGCLSYKNIKRYQHNVLYQGKVLWDFRTAKKNYVISSYTSEVASEGIQVWSGIFNVISAIVMTSSIIVNKEMSAEVRRLIS